MITPTARREVIVDKLNDALSNLRRERDEAHRSKELALERLRLAKEEETELEKSVNALKLQYEKLVSSMANQGSENADDELLKLQKEVKHRALEVRKLQINFVLHLFSLVIIFVFW